MSDEAIKDILVNMGIYSLALAYVGSDRELFRMFKDDFQQLIGLCERRW
jgi:hypothetical protein